MSEQRLEESKCEVQKYGGDYRCRIEYRTSRIWLNDSQNQTIQPKGKAIFSERHPTIQLYLDHLSNGICLPQEKKKWKRKLTVDLHNFFVYTIRFQRG